MHHKQITTVLCAGLILVSQVMPAQIKNDNGTDSVALVSANNRFGIKIFQNMCGQNASKNLSPASVQFSSRLTEAQ